jgi:Ni,Fe-hydrogenase I small subunit
MTTKIPCVFQPARWAWKSKADIPLIKIPGCPVQPDNFMETLFHLLRHAAGTGPMISLDESTATGVALF